MFVPCLQVVTLRDLSNRKWAMNQKVVVDGNDLTKVIELLKGDPGMFKCTTVTIKCIDSS